MSAYLSLVWSFGGDLGPGDESGARMFPLSLDRAEKPDKADHVFCGKKQASLMQLNRAWKARSSGP
jgi:hypothetical protein